MKKIYTFLLYQLLLITSCVSNNTSKNSVLKSIDCKDPIQKNLQEITISSSNFIYGNPYQMKVVDSLLLIVDKWDNDIHIYPGHDDGCTMKQVRKYNTEFIAITEGRNR